MGMRSDNETRKTDMLRAWCISRDELHAPRLNDAGPTCGSTRASQSCSLAHPSSLPGPPAN